MRWLRAAAVAGLVHAAFSLYWALGGSWLLDTVGDWAVELQRDHPVSAGLGLAAIAVAKGLGAVLPAVVRWRWVRVLSWIGGVVLVAYGALNTVIAWLVLGGVIVPDGGYDRAAMVGHAALWDPLFWVWGVLLLTGLARTRAPRDP